MNMNFEEIEPKKFKNGGKIAIPQLIEVAT